jgi:TRAP-type C4-dicarboxylate transport system permease small subunit
MPCANWQRAKALRPDLRSIRTPSSAGNPIAGTFLPHDLQALRPEDLFMDSPSSSSQSLASHVMRALGRVHDLITQAGFILAAIALVGIILAFIYEVVARYFFNAPTEWANPWSTYALCAMIFLAMPELTRLQSHVAISILMQRATGPQAAALRVFIRLCAVFACFLAAFISAEEAWQQYLQTIWTITQYPIPKWMVTIFIPYGMFSSGLYFLRQLLCNQPLPASDGAVS